MNWIREQVGKTKSSNNCYWHEHYRFTFNKFNWKCLKSIQILQQKKHMKIRRPGKVVGPKLIENPNTQTTTIKK